MVCYSNNGQHKTEFEVVECKKLEEGSSEIMPCSIDKDGLMNGYDFDLIKYTSKNLNLPVIASGGPFLFRFSKCYYKWRLCSCSIKYILFYSP